MYQDAYLGPKHHLLLLGSLALVAVALRFAPNAVLGLHYQCVLSSLTGINCPFCGMTRDFILMAHGLRPTNNPGSPFVAFLLYIAYPLWVISGWRGYSSLLVRRTTLTKALLSAAAVLFFCNNFRG